MNMVTIQNGKLVLSEGPAFLIVQLGVGGTGGNVLLSLVKMLRGFEVASVPVACRYLIADGAVVKEHNMENQNFLLKDVGKKKVDVLADRYYRLMNIPIMKYRDYLESADAIHRLVQNIKRDDEILILLGCVDNNRTRQVLHQFFQEYEGDLIYIDSGNDMISGQVVMGAKNKNGVLLPPVCERYPDMLEDKDMFKSEESCQANYKRYPQLQITNEKAADAVVNMVHNLLRYKETDVYQVTFSIKTMSQRAWFIGAV